MLTKIFAFAYRNWIFSKRNIFAFAEILFWPAVGLISIGIMGNFLQLNKNMLSYVLIGAITSGVLQVAQLDVSYGLLYDIWSKSLKHTFIAPVSGYSFIIGPWIIGMLRGLIVFAIMTLFSFFAFGFVLPPFAVTAVFITGIFLNALLIGMIVCLLVMLYGQRVEVTAWSMVAMLMVICGIYYPVNYLPKIFMVISKFIPLTYFMEYFRQWYGFKPVFSDILVKGFSETFAYIILLFYLFRYAVRKSRRTGMILRLSE